MKFYNIESLMDGEKIKASGVDIRRMSSALEIIGNKSELKTLDNIMDYPFVFLKSGYSFVDTSSLVFAEQSKKLTFALVKENTAFQLTNGKVSYFCAIHEGELKAYLNEDNLTKTLSQKSINTTDPVESKALAWLENGQVGLSSATLCATLFPNLKNHFRFDGMLDDDGGIEVNWPHDNSDFGRCDKFFKAVPEAKARLDEMRHVSPEWNNLVDKWSDIEKLSSEGKGQEVYDVISQCVKIKKNKNTF